MQLIIISAFVRVRVNPSRRSKRQNRQDKTTLPSGATSAPPHILPFLTLTHHNITIKYSPFPQVASTSRFLPPLRISYLFLKKAYQSIWLARRRPRLATKVRGASCSALRVSNHSHSAASTPHIKRAVSFQYHHLLLCVPHATDNPPLWPASWNWHGSAPSGEVAEKKTEGEVSVQSKRGNTIKKSAQPDDPAIHLARPGNDVVKNQSELNVEEKASGGDTNGTKETEDETADQEPEAAPAKAQTPAKSPGNKRKATEEPEQEKEAKKSRGRPKGAAAAPKEKKETKEKKGKAAPKEKKEKPAQAEGDKKGRGRPAKDPSAPKTTPKAKKEKKPTKPAAKPVGVGKRTRSQAK